MNYCLLTASIIFSVVSSVCTRIFADWNQEKKISVFAFNLGSCIMWLFLLVPGMLFRSDVCITGYSVLCGVIFGFLLFLLLYCSCRAMEEGPFVLTRLMNCPSFIIPTFFGVICYREGISIKGILGILLICIAMGLCINPRYSGEKITAKWFWYSFVLLVVNGLIGILYKVFGTVSENNDYDAMLVFAAVTACMLYFLFWMKEVSWRRELSSGLKPSFPKGKTAVVMALAGLVTCIYIRLNVYLSGVLPSAVIFPVGNCAIVVLSTCVGVFVFREKLSKSQLLGILIGIAAIIITNS